MAGNTAKLLEIFNAPTLNVTPCCSDALSARLIEQAGFQLAFMSGFCVSARRLGLPDTGLISSTEMIDQARSIAAAVSIPVIGDGDTGYGGALNVKRTVSGYAQSGMSCIMIEDQVSPKRCGHTRGKRVVDRAEAASRIRAAVDARDEGADILILARTDAREELGLEEAIARAVLFRRIGADMTFVEAPKTVDEMAEICRRVEGPGMVNMVEGGLTPMLPVSKLQELGFSIATYPLTALMAAVRAEQHVLSEMMQGRFPDPQMSFEELQETVGFNDFYREEERYDSD